MASGAKKRTFRLGRCEKGPAADCGKTETGRISGSGRNPAVPKRIWLAHPEGRDHSDRLAGLLTPFRTAGGSGGRTAHDAIFFHLL